MAPKDICALIPGNGDSEKDSAGLIKVQTLGWESVLYYSEELNLITEVLESREDFPALLEEKGKMSESCWL